MRSTPLATQTFFKRAMAVAEHYGFCNVDDLALHERPPCESAHTVETPLAGPGKIDSHVIEYALSRLTESIELRKRNAVLFYTPSLVRHAGTPGSTLSAITLNAIGSPDPLTEIVVMKSAATILEELGNANSMLRINSLGDSDSATRFVREVGTKLRQVAKDLPPPLAELLRQDVRAAIAQCYEERHPITETLPRPIEFLTAPSRRHFKQILELLEQTGIPFEIDDMLYGNQNMYAHTIFEFVSAAPVPGTSPTILARGGRYDTLTRSHARSAVPATGVVIAFPTGHTESTDPIARLRVKKPSTCLVHIGREARIKSISIIEAFRRARIPIGQCLQFERFSEQVAYAESRGARYIIILGQREVHDNVVVIRDVSDRSQKTIPLATLTDFVRAVV
ncbi:MAG: ATP phosphoribosyltransferase regulatory subunit [Candidatus Pacebacteria bacterium]|nr:ATP phosphoribosyltransferase regulatory subunit [Candidatus Paceibacterota bacterium]